MSGLFRHLECATVCKGVSQYLVELVAYQFGALFLSLSPLLSLLLFSSLLGEALSSSSDWKMSTCATHRLHLCKPKDPNLNQVRRRLICVGAFFRQGPVL